MEPIIVAFAEECGVLPEENPQLSWAQDFSFFEAGWRAHERFLSPFQIGDAVATPGNENVVFHGKIVSQDEFGRFNVEWPDGSFGYYFSRQLLRPNNQTSNLRGEYGTRNCPERRH